SKAAYAQGSYSLGGISDSLSALKLDLGIRYTRDSQSVCDVAGSPEAVPIVDENQCLSAAGNPANTIHASTAGANSSKMTWTAGLDYQITDRDLLYVVGRKGYRGGGVNTPRLGGTLTPFQSFAPETVTDVEIGAKTQWELLGRPGQFNVAVYH